MVIPERLECEPTIKAALYKST